MHPFMQDRHDPDRPIGQQTPVNVMMLASDIEAVDAELSGDGSPRRTARRDVLEAREQATDVGLRLGLAPGVQAIGIDVVEATARRVLDAKGRHGDQRLALRANTASASRGP